MWKNPKKATKCLKIQKIWGLKKVAPESIFDCEKRCLAAQAPTVGFGGSVLGGLGRRTCGAGPVEKCEKNKPRALELWKNA